MILICGIASEGPLRAAIAAAQRAGVDCVVVDQRNSVAYEISIDCRGAEPVGHLVADGRPLPLESFSGIYARLVESNLLPESQDGGNGTRAHAAALQRALDEWLELAPSRVVNRTSSMASNVSKPYQAQLIREAGLATPTTLVTNCAAEAQAFAAASGGAVFKSVSSVRSIVHALTPERLSRVDQLRQLPTQFQERVRGVDVRVHVVGKRVIATEVASDAVDYRYASRDGLDFDMTATTIPAPVERRCRELAARLDLPFCGIDLKRRPDGTYVCFEVNPSPAYTYYEEGAGQPISDALVEYLDRG